MHHAIQRGGSQSYAQIIARSVCDPAMRGFRLQTRNARLFPGKRIPRAFTGFVADQSIDRSMNSQKTIPWIRAKFCVPPRRL